MFVHSLSVENPPQHRVIKITPQDSKSNPALSLLNPPTKFRSQQCRIKI